MKWLVTYNNVLVNLNQLVSIHIDNEYTSSEEGIPILYNSIIKGILYPVDENDTIDIDIFQGDNPDIILKVFGDIKTFIISDDKIISFYESIIAE